MAETINYLLPVSTDLEKPLESVRASLRWYFNVSGVSRFFIKLFINAKEKEKPIIWPEFKKNKICCRDNIDFSKSREFSDFEKH